MESKRTKIERIEKQDRTEKIVVFSLLIISLTVAFFTFFKNGNNSVSTPNAANSSQVEHSDGTTDISSNAIENSGAKNTGGENSHSTSDPKEIEIINDNTSKEGIYAVGLFKSPENALNAKIKLDSLGFIGAVKTRDDGKLIVGVEVDKSDIELMNRVKEAYSDAIFIKN